jgi:hypothetical protein
MLLPTANDSRIKIRVTLMALTILLWLTSLATATSGQSFEIINTSCDPRITAISTINDKKWDRVIEEDLSYKVAIKGRCSDKWKLKSAKIRRLDGTAEFLKVDTDNRSISPDHGASTTSISIISSYTKPNLRYWSDHIAKKDVFYVSDACDCELDRLVKEGGNRARLLQEGFDFVLWKAYEAELEVVCQDDHIIKQPDRTYHDRIDIHAKVRCEGTGYRPPSRTTPPGAKPPDPKPPQRTPPPPPPLTAVSVAADPVMTKGKTCPVWVNFDGKITANSENKFGTFNTKYRFIGENNYASPWVFVSIDRGETRTVNGRRFIQAPKPDPGGTLIAPGGKPKIPVHNGWMMLEVMLPYGTKRSEKTPFAVDCNPVPTPPKIKAPSE